MKKLIFILLFLPMLGFGQFNLKTYVPDDNFENYLEANGMGDGITLNDSINTLSIEMLMSLDVSNENISDLTGIEDFTVLSSLKCYSNQLTNLDVSNNIYLTALRCQSNQLTSLDVSQNTALNSLFCFSNFLTSLDVSNNTALTYLYSHSNQLTSLDVNQNTDLYFLQCQSNQLTSLDVSNNTALQHLHCYSNQLTSLDVSNDTALTELHCQDNQLTSLDLRNGNNTNMPTFSIFFNATNNPNLYCINVDDVSWSTTNWTVSNGSINTQHYFSNNCTSTEIEEYNANKGILKIIDFLGRETKGVKNQPLFYIYDDGTVEKKIILE
jgi:Leucine-rich repeat (LRR) protein